MNNLLDRLNGLWKKPQPDAEPETPTSVPWVRVGLILRAIPFKKLLPAFVAVPAIVFFAISGLIAWLAVVLKFAVSIFHLWS